MTKKVGVRKRWSILVKYKDMKLTLSWILYGIGHFISFLMRWDWLSFLYPMYRKVMILSSDLDPEGKVWERNKKEKKPFKREWF